jgi:hypothetical protein
MIADQPLLHSGVPDRYSAETLPSFVPLTLFPDEDAEHLLASDSRQHSR